MPTYDITESAFRDLKDLTHQRRDKFFVALGHFIEDLKRMEQGDGDGFRGSLRVKPMQNNDGVWEMTWEKDDGRATFQYGPEQKEGLYHVIWRRLGGHDIFGNP